MKTMTLTRVKSALCAAAALMQLAAPVLAAPQGASVAAGDVSVAQSGATTVIHASNGSVINYQSFNIAGHETVQFVQPDAASRVLNRVLDGRVTQIDGTLLANGQVYIANPAGIFFGGQSVVSVGGLTAAAGTITDQDFRAGIDRFQQMGGDVVAMGRIEAGMVQLIGRRVANSGTIVAPDGTVTMVAGDDVYLSPGDGTVKVRLEGGRAALEGPAVENSGTIEAPRGRVMLGASDVYTLAARNSGEIKASDVRLTGAGGRVENSGTIDASSTDGKGGRVEMLGNEVALYSGSLIDVSGSGGGGEALVGGDAHGGNGVATADRTFVDFEAVVRADALGAGDGGRIIVWADDRTAFYGHVSARGGEFSGNGGFAEVSGAQSLAFKGTADLTAPAGFSGKLLLDPGFIIINLVGGTVITGDRFFTDNSSGTETFLASDIVILLNTADLELDANTDITVNAIINSSGNANSHTLTLNAGRSIFINADVLLNGSFEAMANVEPQDGAIIADRQAGVAVFTMAAGKTISTAAGMGGDIDIEMGRGNFIPGNGGGLITLVNLNAGDGSINIDNHGFLAGSGVTLNGAVTTTGSGDVRIAAFLGSAETVALNGSIVTDSGGIDIQAGGNVTMSAVSSITSNGQVEIQAGNVSDTAGSVIMTDGSVISSREIRLRGVGDVTITRLVSTSGNDTAIEVESRLGAIKNGGNTNGVNIDDPTAGGGAFLIARSIGTSVAPIQFNIAQIITSTVAGGGGNQFLVIHGPLSEFFLNAGTGSVTLTGNAAALDFDNLIDIIAASATVTLTGGGSSFGTSGNKINTAVTNPNFSATGGVFVDSTVNNVTITTPINLTGIGQQFIFSTSGTLTVNASISTSGDNGFIDLKSSGNMTINAPISTSGMDSNIDLTSGGSIFVNSTISATGSFSLFSNPINIEAVQDVIFSASSGITVVSGEQINISADALRRRNGSGGKITMADGVVIDGGTSAIELRADQDITLSRLVTSSGGGNDEAVQVKSFSGAIVKAGTAISVNIEAPNGAAHMEARTGIGSGYELETNVGALSLVMVNGSGNVDIEQAGDLSIVQVVLYNSTGNVTINSGGVLTLDIQHDGDGFPVFLGGGDLTLISVGAMNVQNSIFGADEITLHSGASGMGDLQFTKDHLAFGAFNINLIAGDGLGGSGSTAMVDAKTNSPLFGGHVNGTAVSNFAIRQDGALTDANLADVTQFLGDPTGLFMELTSFDSSVTFSNPAPATLTPNLTVNALTTVDFAGGALHSLTVNAGGTISINGATDVSAAPGVSLTTDRNIVINANLTTADRSVTMFANNDGLTSGNFVGIDLAGGTLDAGSGIVNLNGRGGSTGSGNVGILVSDGATLVTHDGIIALTGVGGNSGPNSHGIFLDFGVVTALGDATLVFDGSATAGTGILADGASVGGASDLGNIVLTAESMAFGGGTDVRSAGFVTFQTASSSSTIGIGGGAAGDLLLSSSTLSSLHDGFGGIVFLNGASVQVGSASFTDPVGISTSGSGSGLIDVFGPLTLDATASLTLITNGHINLPAGLTAPAGLSATGSLVNLNGDVSSSGLVVFDADVSLHSDVTVTAASAIFASRINSDSVGTPRALFVELTGNGVVSFLGSIGAGPNDVFNPSPLVDDLPLLHLETNSPSTGLTVIGSSDSGLVVVVLNGPSAQFNTAAQIASDVEINEVGAGNIAFGGTLNAAPGSSAPALALNTSGGSIVFSSAVGGSSPLGSISTGAGDAVVIGASVSTSGAQNYGGPVNLTGDATLTGSAVNLDQSTLTTNGHTLNTTIVRNENANPASLEATTRGKGNQNAGEDTDTVPLGTLLLGYGITLPDSLAGDAATGRLQSAVDRYGATRPPGAAFDAAAFAAYLKKTPDEAATLTALDDLAKLLAQIDALQLPAEETARLRQRVLNKLAPKGMTPAQLEQLLQALGQKAVAAAF